ncbi:MAG: SDR family oxidoreductase [Moorea sp. SIO2I5]|nr:SDR family oxidoreductase [Moorena sp. SIO2I5]
MDKWEQEDSLEPIAIIGMAGRFPGAKNIDEFWQNLRDGVESISFFTDEELLSTGINPAKLSNSNYVKAASVLSDIDLFDASFFNFTPYEAEVTDPQHRLFLECAWEALENAGHNSEVYKGRIGVYAGAGLNSYLLYNLSLNPETSDFIDVYRLLIGNDKDFVTTRVSFQLNLTGPSVNVSTACSTSLVAVQMGCQSLLNYQSDMVLAGGVTVHLPQKAGYLYQQGMILSPDGHCRAFDAQAQGTVGGNGMGIVVLKRLEDALADGDCIHAVIKGSAINNDGALKVGYTAPSVDGQAAVILEAQALAGISPETITYIEAHGTGTPLGDPIEIAALRQAFSASTQKQGFCAIGSVKTNVGHLDTAAGVAGLIKTVLALKNKQIPPSLNFENPNPEIDFPNSPFYVNTELRQWQTNGTPRRAGVSSFGIGGTNAHVVLEEAPAIEPSGTSRPWQLLLLSAKTSSALESATANLSQHLHSELNLADIAYTLSLGRRTFNHRRMLVCRDIEQAKNALSTLEPKRVFTQFQEPGARPVVFMFSGQGAQYVNMAQELYQNETTFSQQVDLCCQLLKPHLELDLCQVLYPRPEQIAEASEQLQQTGITQPALFVLEYALAQLWIEWGVCPTAMIGHSIGEYVAATLAGVFSLEDALALVAARGKLMQQLPSGSMLAIPIPQTQVQPLLGKELSLAAINGPSSCVVSGSTEAVEVLEKHLALKGLECRRLHTSHAFHSPMMEPILESFTQKVKQVSLKPPQIPYISNVTGTWITPQEATTPSYWATHLRQTVRFGEGLQELWKEPAQILLEIGPGRALTTLAKRHPDKKDQQVALSSVRHPQEAGSDVEFLLKTLGQLWLAGVEVDWSGFYTHEWRHRLPLPTYPFERQRYWIEATQSGEDNHLRPASLVKKPDIADWFYMPCWKQSVSPIPIKQEELTSQNSCTLVFMDECGLGIQLVEGLHRQNQEVISVKVGREFTQVSENLYTLNPGESNDYERLLTELLEKQKSPETIVHLWSVTPVSQTQSRLTGVEKAQETGFYSLLFLTQALGKQNLSEQLQITVVSNNMQSVTGEEVLSTEKATLLGPVKVIPQEYPNITCRSIDVVLPTRSWQQEKLTDQLLTELRFPISEQVIAYRGNNRWLQTFEPVRVDESVEQTPRLREGGVYLITGGLGGIGLVLGKHLAKTVRAKLILTGRSAFPARKEWDSWLATHDETDSTSHKIEKVQELEELGAEVLVISADVANLAQMTDAIAQAQQHFGQLHGVIHAAGVPGGGVIQRKTIEEAQNVLTPKVKGALVLDAIVKDVELDFLILTSSIASILGEFGQVDYTGANAFLDVFAHHKTYQQNLFTLSINWGTWQEVGMAVNTTIPKELQQWHIENLQQAILPKEGIQVLMRLLASRLSQVLVSPTDFLSLLKQHNTNSGVLSKLEKANISKPKHSRPELSNTYVAPRNKIEQKIADMWQQVLGLEPIGIYDDFFELGGDSLIAMTFTNQFQKQLGEIVHASAIFNAPTIAKLANYFQKEYPEVVRIIQGFEASQTRITLKEKVNTAKIAQLRQLIPSLLERQETDTTKNPSAIFILSPPRTGSTLLRVILGGHPQLFAPPELNLILFDTLSERKAAFSESEKFLLEGTIRALKQIKNCTTEEAKCLMQEFEEQEVNTKQLYAIIQQYIGDKILVDKNPIYTLNIDILKRIEAEFENALYIHLLRHPYGMIHSFEEAKLDLLMEFIGGSPFSRREIAELIWLISNQNIVEFLEHIPKHRQHCVKFENLVDQPQNIVNGICQFLGLDFNSEMLYPYRDKNQRMTDGLYSVSRMIGDPKFHQHKGIEAKVANSWRQDYSIDFLSDVTWQLADLFEYKRIIEIVADHEEGEI